jgi:hypothetical protein
MWHQRAKWDSATSTWKAYRPVFHAVGFNKNLVCDSKAGAVYNLSTTVYTDVDGDELRRLRSSPHTVNESKRVFYDRFELELESGLGLASGQGSDPTVMMRYSDDGGKTWSNERTASAGARGSYGTRVRFLQCGSGRDRIWEVTMSDPVPWRLVDAYIDAAGGEH